VLINLKCFLVLESLPEALSLVGEFPHDFESSASYSQHSYAEQGKHCKRIAYGIKGDKDFAHLL
jgi:hypothetical protein